MALSKKANEKLVNLKNVIEEAIQVLEKLNMIALPTEMLCEIKNYEAAINSFKNAEFKTSDQVDAAEIEINTAFEALKKIRETNYDELEKMANPTMDDTETKEDEEDEKSTEEIENIIYVGPTLKKYGITSNTSFKGTRTDTYNFFAQVIEDIPEVKKMLVSTTELADKRKLLKAKNNAFYNDYKEIERKSKEV